MKVRDGNREEPGWIVQQKVYRLPPDSPELAKGQLTTGKGEMVR